MHFADGATILDPDEIEGLRFKHIFTRNELDQLEQASVTDGLLWLSKQVKPDLFSEKFVRDLHRKLFGQVWRWAGTFRSTEKNIGIPPCYISTQLRQLLDDARFWVGNETYPPKELVARLHHRLVAIHLFPNGNGRHARIFADAVLTKLLDAPPIDWSGGFGLEKKGERRTQYIQALRAADAHNFELLLKFVQA